MSNMGLEVALRENGISLIRTDVGDRYVMDAMRRERLNLGGEPSGHIIFLHHTTSGDGTLAALRVLSVMCQQGRPLSEVRRVFSPFPQVTRNVAVVDKKPLHAMPKVDAVVRAAEEALKGRGRLLIRYSGTERIARIMLEGENPDEIERLASGIADEIRLEIGS